MALVMDIVSPCVRPKRVHKQEILISARDFACPRRARGRQEHEQHSEPSDFGGILASLGSYFGVIGYMGLTLGSLWDHFGIIVESLWVY